MAHVGKYARTPWKFLYLAMDHLYNFKCDLNPVIYHIAGTWQWEQQIASKQRCTLISLLLTLPRCLRKMDLGMSNTVALHFENFFQMS